jgi:hypothetical protein
MKRLLIVLAMVAGCGSADGGGGNAADPAAAAGSAGAPAAKSEAPAKAGQTTLAGLYESGAAGQPNQLCILDDGKGTPRFGLIVWGGNLHSCSGEGTATREGEKLTLAMSGDSQCRIDATVRGGTITLPASVPEGCSYYCGARARLTGASFTQKGTSEADARRARDLVNEPLCE